VTDVDAAGWRPSPGDLDRYGREIPDAEYGTPDFERKVALKARTEAIAAHLARFLDETDPMAKTIVFCVDQEHASEVAIALGNRNRMLMQTHPNYVVRVTADEGDVGRAHLAAFQDIESTTPVVLTTSQLLTTGVDAPTCKNVVLARVVGSMTEFKQIIGRGTRVREDYGKLSFNILDYTGSATQLFADPEFDGDPVVEDIETIDASGATVERTTLVELPATAQGEEEPALRDRDGYASYDPGAEERERRKFYVDEGTVEIVAHLVYELDPDGKQLGVVKFTDYTADKVRMLVPSTADLRAAWANPEQRAEMLAKLEERGLTPDVITSQTGMPEADTFDLLCHLAFNRPVRTRRERADRVAKERAEFFARFGPEARQILSELLEKYAEHGVAQLKLPDVLKVPPIADHGNPSEIAAAFGGRERLVEAVADLQALLYEEPEAA
jgi:type I restriction enzyme R subunit